MEWEWECDWERENAENEEGPEIDRLRETDFIFDVKEFIVLVLDLLIGSPCSGCSCSSSSSVSERSSSSNVKAETYGRDKWRREA